MIHASSQTLKVLQQTDCALLFGHRSRAVETTEHASCRSEPLVVTSGVSSLRNIDLRKYLSV